MALYVHHQCCAFVFLLVCLLVFFSSRVECADEWGRWSVHLTRMIKTELSGWGGDKVKLGPKSCCLIRHPSWSRNVFFLFFWWPQAARTRATDTVMAAWRSGTRRIGRKGGEGKGASEKGGGDWSAKIAEWKNEEHAVNTNDVHHLKRY